MIETDNIHLLIQLFDIERYLDAKHVPYWTEGKNVKQGWINVQCMWCDDHSNHLGINPETGGINCWKCPAHGTVLKLVMKIEGCNAKRGITILKSLTHSRTLIRDTKRNAERMPAAIERNVAIEQASKTIVSIYRDYLEGRKFDADMLYKKYGLLSGPPIGDFAWRLIIPFIEYNRIVTFTGKDISGNPKAIPYRHLEKELSILHAKETLYNIGNCQGNTIVIVEGPTDVWRMGDDFAATCGIQYSQEQVLKLTKYRRVILLFDTEPEAQTMAKKFGADLALFVPDVLRFELPSGDPGELSDADAKSIRRELLGRIY